jgi:hypothetical protein
MAFFLWAAIACNGETTGEELGEYTTDTGGLTEDIPFAVPDGSSSAVVYCGPYGDNLLGTAWEIKDADGNYVYTNEFHDDYAPTKMRVGNLDDMLPVLMPVSPDLDLSAGDHTMKVWIAAGGEPVTVKCDALYRTGSVPNDGTIDIHFWFVGTDLNESNVEKDEDWSTVLAHVRKWWGAGGLEVGDVTYDDFTGSVDQYTVLDADSEFNDLLRTTDEDGEVLTIFLVQEITSSSGGTILGQSAGPPGLPTVSGTSKSGWWSRWQTCTTTRWASRERSPTKAPISSASSIRPRRTGPTTTRSATRPSARATTTRTRTAHSSPRSARTAGT